MFSITQNSYSKINCNEWDDQAYKLVVSFSCISKIKIILLLALAILLSSCAGGLNAKLSPKLKARKQFEQTIATQYGQKHAKNILRYDLLGLQNERCIISSLYSNAYNPYINLAKYEQQISKAETKLQQLSEQEKSDNIYAKLTLMANLYNLHIDKLKINSTKSKPKPRSFKRLLNYSYNFHKKFRSVPVYDPMQNFQITSNYGPRFNPYTKKPGFHHGIDLIANHEYIYSTISGRVTFAGKMGGYGNLIKINHGNNVTTYYAHLAKIYVKKGAVVGTGQVIGLMGSTGNSTAKHLHYEIRNSDRSINPYNFLNNNCY